MATPESVVVVSAGVAGANTALTLRELGYDGRVVLVGAEKELPYKRPPLSKDYLRGESSLADAYVKSASDYEALSIELVRGRTATAIDSHTRRVDLDDGSSIPYSVLVIATGAEPRRLDVPGSDLPFVHYLRSVGDADALRNAAAKAESVVVVGGGWIGTEAAASLRQMGKSVTIVSRTPRPLERVLGPEVAEAYRELHLANGVQIVAGSVDSIDRQGVNLSDGTHVAADLVVVGVGATARVTLARQAGLPLRDDAIEVDEHLRSSDLAVYAAGDVAAAWHPRFQRYVRVEHIDNAKQQGKAVAANILGAGKPYARTPFFYSDQFDLGMEYRGFAPEWDRVVIRGDVRGRKFHAFWLARDRVVAAMNANLWNEGAKLEALVETDRGVDLHRLADPAIDLAEAA